MSPSLGRKLNSLWLLPASGVLLMAIAAVIWMARLRFESAAVHAPPDARLRCRREWRNIPRNRVHCPPDTGSPPA